jgi:hydrogenase expression/formation protein HypC
MCLALPGLVIELPGDEQAVADFGGIRKTINVALVPEVRVGDYVIVHVGHAIGILDPAEAAATLELFGQMQPAPPAAQP